MSILTLNMSDYELVNEAPLAALYDEELLNTGWTPNLGLQPSLTTPNPPFMPSHLAGVDIDDFLNNMYLHQGGI